MNSFLVQLAVVAAGVTALHIFYRALEVRWPQFYYSASDTFTRSVSASPWRYLAFRIVPVFAVSFFVSASMRRADFAFVWSPLAVAAIHAATTNGNALLLAILHTRRSFGFWAVSTQHLVALLGSLVGGLSGLILAKQDWALRLVPSPNEIAGSLWTAIIAAALGAYAMKFSGPQSADIEGLIKKSRKSIDDILWRQAEEVAVSTNTDPLLVVSIMLVENLQRPRWFRQLENILAYLGHHGTYGIMQVQRDYQISDIESVRIACTEHLRNARPYFGDFPDPDSIREVAKRHNGDDAFIEMTWQIYYRLWLKVQSSTPN